MMKVFAVRDDGPLEPGVAMYGSAGLGLATNAACGEPGVASLALMAGLCRAGLRVQHFRARACPTGLDRAAALTGLPDRHLDPWLMPAQVCRAVYQRGTRQCDLAVVEGQIHWPGEIGRAGGPGLAPVGRALDLPIIAVVPCRGWEGFILPPLAPEVDAVLLDGLERPEDFEPLCRLFRLLAQKPVIGAVESLPEVREGLKTLRPRQELPPQWIDELAGSFLRFGHVPTIRAFAESRPAPPFIETLRLPSRGRFRVAYAQDDAFGFYFPDTLETLVSLGAELVEFSPLRHDTLPPNVELVLIGCGSPERHAGALAANVSLIASLRRHVCDGRRIYSEGGGTAYLCRRMILRGRPVAGADILPLDAVLQSNTGLAEPVSRTLHRDSWLGRAGTLLRGYRTSRWRLTRCRDSLERPDCSGSLDPNGDIVHHHHAIGSLIHFHPAAFPELAVAWSRPHRPSLARPGSGR